MLSFKGHVKAILDGSLGLAMVSFLEVLAIVIANIIRLFWQSSHEVGILPNFPNEENEAQRVEMAGLVSLL